MVKNINLKKANELINEAMNNLNFVVEGVYIDEETNKISILNLKQDVIEIEKSLVLIEQKLNELKVKLF